MIFKLGMLCLKNAKLTSLHESFFLPIYKLYMYTFMVLSITCGCLNVVIHNYVFTCIAFMITLRSTLISGVFDEPDCGWLDIAVTR